MKGKKHDNELATFVIGLANVTVINIYGEVPGDMDDILQTTVYAFLRMKTVKLKPSCVFVHQNVSELTAGSKGEMGRTRFVDKLDKMTEVAAEKEYGKNDVKFFKEVIDFNPSRDVFHFPNLWHGGQPMVSVSGRYSDKASALKAHLIQMIVRSRSQDSTAEKLSMISERIKDLWKALLNENFVFSFKNTLEIVVHNELEEMIFKWENELDNKVREWENKKRLELVALEREDKEFENSLLTKQLLAFIGECLHEVSKEMNTYFETSEHKSILEHWKKQTKTRIQDTIEALKKHT